MGLTFNAERVLRWLIDQPQGATAFLPDGIVPCGREETTYDELLQAGLVLDTRPLDGGFEFVLTPAGRVEAAQTRDHGYRAALVVRRILEWLEDAPRGHYADFMASDYAQDFTGPITEKELEHGLSDLEEGGFIETTRAFGGEVLFAQLTARGRWLLRTEMSIDQIEMQGAATTMNISSHNFGTQHIGAQTLGGQGHTITGSVTSGVSMAEALNGLEAFITSLDTAEASDTDVANLREDAEHIRSRAERRGLPWVLDQIKALINAGTPVLGREGTQMLLQLVSGQ